MDFTFWNLPGIMPESITMRPNLLKLLYQTLRALTNPHLNNRLVRYIYELKVVAINGEGATGV